MSPAPLTEQDLSLRIRQVIARTLEVPLEQVLPETRQGDFEKWDSLGHLNVVMELEAAFGVSFSTDEAIAMRSVQEAVAMLAQRLSR